MDRSSHAERIGAFIAQANPRDLPDTIIEKAKRHVLDTFGAALAGAGSDEARAVRAMLQASGGSGSAPIWGTKMLLAPRDAALANGVAAHALELDDTGGCDHSGAVVLPAAVSALTLADLPVSGAEFLLAVVLGYEVARRMLEAFGGYQPHNAAGWHSTGTCGVFGAAATACRILRLKPAACGAALGLSASFAGGLWAFIHDGSQAKRVHAGRAAEGGLLAALLARGGITGPARVFDDVWGGILPTLAHGPTNAEALVDGLGRAWRISRAAIKPYASCRGTHGAVDAVGAMMQDHAIASDAVIQVVVRLSPFLNGMCGGRDIRSLPAAQMSLPYAVAVRIALGHANLSAYAASWRKDETLRAMMDRVSLQVDAGMEPDAEPAVAIRTAAGRRFEAQVTAPLGAPDNPLSDAALTAKFMELAGLTLPQEVSARLRDTVMRLEVIQDARDLQTLIVPPMDSLDSPCGRAS